MSLTTKAIQNLALKQNKARTQGDRLAVIVDLVIDLGWDRDRLSEDGQRAYDELCEVLHLPTCKEDDDDKHLRELQEKGLNGYDKIESEDDNG